MTTFDTGRGFKFQLGGLASGESGEFTFNFAKAGNNVTTQSSAQTYMAEIDEAISSVNKALSYIGARTNRMTVMEESLAIAKVNTEAARSRILDADMAYEQFEATKLQILQQTATAMVAQANSSSQAILTLFR
jgi:flagellin